MTETFSLATAAANRAPTLDTPVADLRLQGGDKVAYTLPAQTFLDADGDVLKLTAKLSDGSALPDWLSFDPVSRSFTGTAPTTVTYLNYNVVVTATDPSGSQVSDTFLLGFSPNYGHSTTFNDNPNENQHVTGANYGNDFFRFADASSLYQWADTAAGDGIVIWKRDAPDHYDVLIGFEKLSFSDRTITLSNNTGPDFQNDPAIVQTLVGTSTLDRFIVNGLSTDYQWGPTEDGKAIVIWTVSQTDDTYDILKGFEQLVFLDKTVSLVDTPTNHAPVVDTPIADTRATSGFDFSFALPDNTFTDADHDTLTLSAKQADGSALPTWLTFDATTRTFTGSAPTEDNGKTYVIEVTASDGHGGTVTDTFDIEVGPFQRPPRVYVPIADQVGSVDSDFTFTVPNGTFTNTIISYSATLADGTALPSWLTFDAATKTFHGTPAAGQSGAFEIKVTAHDSNGLTGSDVFVLNIAPEHNTAPVVDTPIADQHAINTWSFDFTLPANTFSDADHDTLTLSAKLAGNAPLPTWLTFDAATGSFHGAPSSVDVGKTYSIEVTASDGKGGTVTDTFDIDVGQWDRPPRLWTPVDDQTATVDHSFTFTVPNGTFMDNNIVGYSATLSDGTALPSWLSFNSATHTFTGTPGAGQVGTFEIKITAIDESGGTGSDIFKLTIGAGSTAETIHHDTAANQYIEGGAGKDVFVIDAASTGYTWGATGDGKGIIVWNDKGYDILFNVEEVRFTNKVVTAESILGNTTSTFHDDADATQYLTGKTASDTFVIAGQSSDYGWGETQDGHGVVVWHQTDDNQYDILTGFDKLVFDDKQVDISDLGHA